MTRSYVLFTPWLYLFSAYCCLLQCEELSSIVFCELLSFLCWLQGDNINCCCQSLCRVQPCVTPWPVARQAPLSMEFFRQGYWSGLPFPPPGDLPNPGIKPVSPALVGRFFTNEPPGKPNNINTYLIGPCRLQKVIYFYFFFEVQLMYNISFRCTIQ